MLQIQINYTPEKLLSHQLHFSCLPCITEWEVSTKMEPAWYQGMSSAHASHSGKTVHLRQKTVAGFMCVCFTSPQVMQASRQQDRETAWTIKLKRWALLWRLLLPELCRCQAAHPVGPKEGLSLKYFKFIHRFFLKHTSSSEAGRHKCCGTCH